MLLVYKDGQVVYKTSDFKDAFEYAKKLANNGYKAYITTSRDKPLYAKPKRIPLKWGDDDD